MNNLRIIAVIIICFAIGFVIGENLPPNQLIENHIKRKQPYVYLNTEERIKAGDTLYVYKADADTIVAY